MEYKYAVEKVNYEDYAAGRVLYTQAGMTSFPVRLASEIFQRCAALLPQKKQLRVYDPCCGSAYLLTTLGFLHGTQLKALWASDIQLRATTLARKNLALLTQAGLAQRQLEIQTMLHDYGKTSHADALLSIDALKSQLPRHTVATHVWLADAMQPPLKNACVDVLLTDVPYGDVVSWNGVMGETAVYQLLETHYPLLARPSVVAIISDKKQKASHPNYIRILQETLGKRRITLLQPHF